MTDRRIAVALCMVALMACMAACGGMGTHHGMAEEGDTVRFRYATLLTVVRYPSHTHVEIKNPWRKGVTLRVYDFDKPIERAVVTTTSHCRLLVDLGAETAIAGVCDAQYIHVPAIQERLRSKLLADCGNSMSPEVEVIVESKADAVVVSPFENNGGYGLLEKLGIPIIEAADYMEPSAMARAEWMRLYGILFGKEREADSLFHVVDSTYRALSRQAIKCPQGRSILTERKTGSVWYCPGGQSSMGRLIADANGAYAFADDGHSGSLALPFEQVVDRAGEADVWVLVASGAPLPTLSSLAAEYHGYKGIKAFRTGEVYVCDASSTAYFEEVPFRPDYLLRDLIQLLHPGTDLGGFRYYRQIE